MALQDAITTARQRGIPDDAILQKMAQDKPDYANSIKAAQGRGIPDAAILDKISQASAPDAPGGGGGMNGFGAAVMGDSTAQDELGTVGPVGSFVGGMLDVPFNAVKGIVKGAASTFKGLGGLVDQGINAVTGANLSGGLPSDTMTQSNGFVQGAGKIAEQAGEFAAPGAIEEKGAALAGSLAGKAADVANLGEKGIAAITKFGTKAAKLPIAGATFAGINSAQTGKAPTLGDAITGTVFQGAGELLGATWRGVKGALADNVGKALNFTAGKDAVGSLEKGTSALKTIVDMAPNIVVKDVDGISKTFDPAKADWWETAQAVTKTKQAIYKEYTDMVAKAGDEGSKFAPADFTEVMSKLDALKKNSTGDMRGAVDGITNDFEANGWVTEGGKFNSASLSDMQDYVQNLNNSINGVSQAAKSVVSKEASDAIRQVMDSKIANATGEQYQAVRNKYAEMMTVEKPIQNQLKKSLRGATGVPSYMEGFGSLDTMVAALSGNPAEALRGAGLSFLGASMKYLRDSENRLRWAFQQIQEQSSGVSNAIGGFKSGTVLPGAVSSTVNTLNPPPTQQQ